MKPQDIEKRSIQVSKSILEALKLMDSSKTKLLFVFDEKKFVGLLTIGDVQRAILKDVVLSSSIFTILDKNKVYASVDEPVESIKNKMSRLRAECMPVLDQDGNLVEVYYWKDLFGTSNNKAIQDINLPVVIMAGGKGTRLAPLTNVYPKPLIPIGEKTIVETIMDKFVDHGCHYFYMSVNYKADTIKNYFDFINNPDYNIHYFQEKKPLGTAGSLRLLKDKINTTFFVSNCDILIEEDYSEILNYHRSNNNELTVVAAVKTLSIPYGTIITGENGILESIEEKPTLSFKINTGLYILEPSLLNDIPNEFYHITHLMEKLKTQGRRVGVYPISQNDWKDMGEWNEYLKMIKVR
ncbi:MAG: nucleotidyltransferase family protein [Alphaproteobacteria bacterium]|nr:nucleotidyltransferase family protein [Bacteroidales bacterium]MBQ2883406.1 nucleotidyltransferase family protein [Alphaproteobacteria bacterium]